MKVIVYGNEDEVEVTPGGAGNPVPARRPAAEPDALNRVAAALEKIAAVLECAAAQDGTAVSALPPEGLSVGDAARFIGTTPAAVEHLIRTRKLAYVQTGSQRGRIVPVEALRELLAEFRQEALGLPRAAR